MDILEGTSEFNRHHRHVTGEIPITVHNGGDGMTPDMVTVTHSQVTPDPFFDDEPIVASCDLSTPETCESCM